MSGFPKSHLQEYLDAVEATKTPSQGWHSIWVYCIKEQYQACPVWTLNISSEIAYPLNMATPNYWCGQQIYGGVTNETVLRVTFFEPDEDEQAWISKIEEKPTVKRLRDIKNVMHEFYFGSVQKPYLEILEFFRAEAAAVSRDKLYISGERWLSELTEKMNRNWSMRDHMSIVGDSYSMYQVQENKEIAFRRLRTFLSK